MPETNKICKSLNILLSLHSENVHRELYHHSIYCYRIIHGQPGSQYQWRHLHEIILYAEIIENGHDNGLFSGRHDLAGLVSW